MKFFALADERKRGEMHVTYGPWYVLAWATLRAEKSLIERRFRAVKVPASGNAFMEIMTDKRTRTTFLLAETRTWKAGLVG